MRRVLYLVQKRTFSHMSNGGWRKPQPSFTRWRTVAQYPTSMEAFNFMAAADNKGLAQFRITHRQKVLVLMYLTHHTSPSQENLHKSSLGT